MRPRRLSLGLVAAVAAAFSLGAVPASGSLTQTLDQHDAPTDGDERVIAPDDPVLPAWAAAADASVHPGTQVRTATGQCTSNFIFVEVGTDKDGAQVLQDVLIGMAAHCAGTDGNTATDGCIAGSRDLGEPVNIDGATQPGTLTYSSWLAMQEGGADLQPSGACAGNDFALVSIHPDDWASTNPSLPHWGGPVAIGDATSTGESNYSFGNSSLRRGVEQLSPKQGVTAAMTNDDWTHVVYAVSPGIPGDSGSGTLDSEGAAIGVTSVVYLAPYAAGNGLSDVGKALDYARAHTGRDYRLVLGTESFNPNRAPIG